MSKRSNNLAAKHCVGWYEHHEETDSEDKISDPKTKRMLTQYYIRKINELGRWGEDE